MVLALGSLLLNPNEMKHIESIQPEYAAFELDRIGREETDATASAALTALLHNVTGCAIPPTADTPQSEVEELVPLCLSILRRHWTTPLTALGDGTTPMSLADLMRRLIGDRVQGNEAWSIPPFTANIPTAVAALRDRKIVADSVPDGISLMLLVLSRTNGITKIGDGFIFDLCYKSHLYALIDALPDLNEMEIHCKRLTGYDYNRQVWFPSNITKINGSSEVLEIPELERFEGLSYCGFPSEAKNFKVWSFPNMTYSRTAFSNAMGIDPNYHNDWVEEIRCPKIKQFGGYASESNMGNFDVLRKVTLGAVTADITNGYHQAFYNDPNLIHLEFGADGGKVAISLWLNMWNPTNALDASRTDLIEEGSTAANNLEQFLSNFKTYIAQRLTDKGSGKTLTLSQAVRDAIQQDPDIVNIITSKGWTISPAPSV